MDGTHDPIHTITPNERQIFDYLLRPDDSYDTNGVYWADMPLAKRAKFVGSYDAVEAKRELSTIGAMFKKDPLSPVSWYFRNMVIPGAGLGLEGYVLFSIGNLGALFTAPGSFTDCWGSPYKQCSEQWVYAVVYMEILGIMVGQVLVGVLGELLPKSWIYGSDACQVIGSVEDGVSSRMLRSCSSACSCSLLLGALL